MTTLNNNNAISSNNNNGSTSNNSFLTESQAKLAALGDRFNRSIEEVLNWAGNLPEGYFANSQFSIDRTKSSNKMDRNDFFKRLTMFLYDFEVHPMDESVVFAKPHGGEVYEVCTSGKLYKIVSELWELVFRCTPVREIEECVINIIRSVNKKAEFRNRVFAVCKGLYFVAGCENNLRKSIDENAKCYFTMEGPYNMQSQNPDLSYLIMEEYNKFKAELYRDDRKDLQFENFYEELPTDLECFKLWAYEPEYGWRDRYWDDVISHSTPYFKKLIDRDYFLDGPERSGKSTSTALLRFTIGSSAAMVPLSEYSDEHFNHKLVYCVINAPDEERKGRISNADCQVFKSLSAKIPKNLQVMRSNEPIMADGQFMSFHPTNNNIIWPDGESGPCQKRIITLTYPNDLSRYDNNGEDPIQEIFVKHPEVYAKYLGTVFALAEYFSRGDKKFFLSPQTAIANKLVSSEVNSVSIYYDEFFRYFNGVSDEDFLYDDYKYACYEYGWVQQSKSALRQRFLSLFTTTKKPNKLKCDPSKGVRSYKLVTRNAHADILCPQYKILEFKSELFSSAEAMHANKVSVVACIKNYNDRIKEEEEEARQEVQDELEKFIGKKNTKTLLGDNYVEKRDD